MPSTIDRFYIMTLRWVVHQWIFVMFSFTVKLWRAYQYVWYVINFVYLFRVAQNIVISFICPLQSYVYAWNLLSFNHEIYQSFQRECLLNSTFYWSTKSISPYSLLLCPDSVLSLFSISSAFDACNHLLLTINCWAMSAKVNYRLPVNAFVWFRFLKHQMKRKFLSCLNCLGKFTDSESNFVPWTYNELCFILCNMFWLFEI